MVIAQMGQDRAGYYSYDGLQRLVGLDVHNAARIVPEWQQHVPGDFVRMAPANYLGGVFGPDLGWRVAAFEPNRQMVLASPFLNWTLFLEPVDERTTRLLVRSRGTIGVSPSRFFGAIVGVTVLRPVHFVMERKMLLTVKRLAEEHTPRG
jgi:hypothetical protein